MDQLSYSFVPLVRSCDSKSRKDIPPRRGMITEMLSFVRTGLTPPGHVIHGVGTKSVFNKVRRAVKQGLQGQTGVKSHALWPGFDSAVLLLRADATLAAVVFLFRDQSLVA